VHAIESTALRARLEVVRGAVAGHLGQLLTLGGPASLVGRRLARVLSDLAADSTSIDRIGAAEGR
jgi:hypothetical protein